VGEVDSQWFFLGIDSTEAISDHLNNTSHMLTEQIRLAKAFGPGSVGHNHFT
jgi:hypothetical protein